MASWLLNNMLLADWATDILRGMDSDQRFSLTMVVIGCLTGVICTLFAFLSSTITSIHHRRQEVAMKREMIERGMSADEITKVVEAAWPLEDGAQRWNASWARKKRAR